MIQDYMSVCNNFEISNEQFEKIWCVRCKNTECQRSFSQSAWLKRVSTQVDTMLINPTIVDKNDPQYEGIRKQHFDCLNPQKDGPTTTYSIADIREPTNFILSTSDSKEESKNVETTKHSRNIIIENVDVVVSGDTILENVDAKSFNKNLNEILNEPDTVSFNKVDDTMKSVRTESKFEKTIFIKPGDTVTMSGK
jgi:hypothetical protein